MELFQKGLQTHSGATGFISIDFNESCITSVIAALTVEFFYNSLFSWQDPASIDGEEQKKVARTRD